MESRSFDLLHTTNTSMIGDIGERIAWYYLFHQGITGHRWGSLALEGPNWRSDCQWLTEEQKHYLNNWEQRGETWVWDFIGLGRNQRVHLVEVKTSRSSKPKRGLKGNWRGRSRGAINKEDLHEARQLNFHLLLVNVELYDNWQCVVTSKELLAEVG